MAKYFDEQEIDTYRECFNFNEPTGIVEQPKALGLVMRSLGLCPTASELANYYTSNASSDGKINFAAFLNILHEHKKKENATEQALSAFSAHDSSHSGYIRSKDLIRILTQTGEKLDRQTELTPNANFVEFNGPSAQTCMGSILLANRNQQVAGNKSTAAAGTHIAFRVRTNAPSLFAAKPNNGIVKIGSQLAVSFQYHPPKEGAAPVLPSAPSVVAALGNNVNPAVRYKIMLMAKPVTEAEAQAQGRSSHSKSGGVVFTDAEITQNVVINAKLYAVFSDTKADVFRLHQHRSDLALAGGSSEYRPKIVTTSPSDQNVPGAVSAAVSFTNLTVPGTRAGNLSAQPSKSGDLPAVASSTASAMKAAFGSSDAMRTTKGKPIIADKSKLGVGGGSKHSVKLVEPSKFKQRLHRHRRKLEQYKRRLKPYLKQILLVVAAMLLLSTLGYKFGHYSKFWGKSRPVNADPEAAIMQQDPSTPESEEALLNQDWSS